jgi:hypothetical protein
LTLTLRCLILERNKERKRKKEEACLKVLFGGDGAGEAEQEGGAHVQMKVGEALGLGVVGVPEADGGGERELAHQQVVHPAEGELHEADLVAGEVGVEAAVDAPHQLLQRLHAPLDARLREDVVLLDALQQLAQAPVRVRLYLPQLLQRQPLNVHLHGVNAMLYHIKSSYFRDVTQTVTISTNYYE